MAAAKETTDEFKVTVPVHNPECDGCLERALTIGAMGKVLSRIADSSENNGRLLALLLEESKANKEVRDSHAAMKLILYGDGTKECPGIIAMVHTHQDFYEKARTALRANKWIMIVLTAMATPLGIVMYKTMILLLQHNMLP